MTEVMSHSPDSRNRSEASLTVTDAAHARLRQVLCDEGLPGGFVRLAIQGGGCAGFSYSFQLAEEAGDDDLVIGSPGDGLLVDPITAGYLEGATLDLKKALVGSQLIVDNPRASNQCGCGSSFTL